MALCMLADECDELATPAMEAVEANKRILSQFLPLFIEGSLVALVCDPRLITVVASASEPWGEEGMEFFSSRRETTFRTTGGS